MKKPEPADRDELRSHYDFRNGVRGKYADRFATGAEAVAVVLDPDVAKHFPTSERVNSALRHLVTTGKTAV